MKPVESKTTSKPHKFSLGVLWRILASATGIYVSFTISFILVHYGSRLIDWTPSSYTSMLLVLVLTLILFALVGATIARFTGWWDRQDAWHSLLEALHQISQGNFHVRVDPGTLGAERHDHPVQQLVQSINKVASELGQLEELRQEFISNVSHEIQSPLSSIAGFAQLLRASYPPHGEEQSYLDIIHMESMRLSRLTENLLKLTSLESGYHPIHMEFYAVDRQIHDVIIALEPLWSEKGLHMEIALPHLNARGDSDLLYQVWMNLLSNAIKFTPERGSITVTGHMQTTGLTITVSDTGIGIPLHEQDRIFERFYKADPSRNRAISGSGLGLAIVKKIVDLHRGRLVVESAPTVGTSITVELATVFS